MSASYSSAYLLYAGLCFCSSLFGRSENVCFMCYRWNRFIIVTAFLVLDLRRSNRIITRKPQIRGISKTATSSVDIQLETKSASQDCFHSALTRSNKKAMPEIVWTWSWSMSKSFLLSSICDIWIIKKDNFAFFLSEKSFQIIRIRIHVRKKTLLYRIELNQSYWKSTLILSPWWTRRMA